jgi:high affinity Mn2+ porin
VKTLRNMMLVAAAASGCAWAAEAGAAELARPAMPVKAPPVPPAPPPFDWSGLYGGVHVGYAAGRSDWTATGAAAAAPISSALDFFEAYDAFKGTGSYHVGLQAGYNHMLPSRLLLGVEADVSFPNTIAGQATFATPALGEANYAETVDVSGTLRARFGYAPANWLIYATAGLAWSYDRFTRTQLAGTPPGAIAAPGTVEILRKLRTGWAAGAGVETPVAPGWTAKLEYLFTGYGSHGVTFPAAAQRFDADLAVHSLRLGLNYRIDATRADAFTPPSAPEADTWAFHGQTTYVSQYALPFRAPYGGRNSLAPNQGRETWDVTLYAGLKLWSGAELWVNPEIDQGFGLSSTLGVAGFLSGEAYKVGAVYPYARLQKIFIRQTIGLGGNSEKVEGDINQFAGSQQSDRLVFMLGKFSVGDVFDTNKYANNPRKDFLNWSLINTGTFDYAADAWGYSYGATAEWYQGPWTVRAGLFDLSIVPNSTELDPRFSQFQMIGEVERRYELWGRPGKLAVTAFLSRGRMGSYGDAVALANLVGGPAEIAAVRRYRSRYGISANAEQQLTDELGLFARAGLARGDVEPYEFADIDHTAAAGLSLAGKQWGRPDDTFGLAGVVNGISRGHQAFFNAGGLGILVGDGRLPNPGPELIMETYYSLPLSAWRLTFDYQFVVNPGYNRDRGPVSVIGTRLRTQF